MFIPFPRVLVQKSPQSRGWSSNSLTSTLSITSLSQLNHHPLALSPYWIIFYYVSLLTESSSITSLSQPNHHPLRPSPKWIIIHYVSLLTESSSITSLSQLNHHPLRPSPNWIIIDYVSLPTEAIIIFHTWRHKVFSYSTQMNRNIYLYIFLWYTKSIKKFTKSI